MGCRNFFVTVPRNKWKIKAGVYARQDFINKVLKALDSIDDFVPILDFMVKVLDGNNVEEV
jgi:hypothetical protein